MHRRRLVPAFALLSLAAAGCGGGGGGGGAAEGRVLVLPHVLEVPGTARRCAVADLDGDGLLDLVVHDPGASSVFVLESTARREAPSMPGRPPHRWARGAAAYEAGARTLVPAVVADLAVGDLDGDGVPDLLVAGGPSMQVEIAYGARVDLGTARYHEWRWPAGAETFVAADRVATGDVNGDGTCDVVVLDEAAGTLCVLEQAPLVPRTFSPQSVAVQLGPCTGLVLADFDRDGHLDVVTHRPADDVLVVVHGPLLGAPSARESPTRTSAGRALAVGDVDGDGWLDVVLLAEGGRALVLMHQRPDGSGTFDAAVSPIDVALREDGAPVAVLGADERGPLVAGVPVDEAGRSRHGAALGIQGTSQVRRCVGQVGLALCDVDRDGVLDVVGSPTHADPDPAPVVCYGQRHVTATFLHMHQRLASRVRESPTLPRSHGVLAVADLDGDGHADLVCGTPDADRLRIEIVVDRTPPSALAYVERQRVVPTAQTTGRCLVDLDRDGRPDVVTASASGVEVRFQALGTPDGFAPPLVLLPGTPCAAVVAGDVDGDGCPDLVVGTPDAVVTVRRDPAASRGFLAPVTTAAPGLVPGGVALGDLDGDGVPDLVALRESPTRTSHGRGDGAGGFAAFFDVFADLPEPRSVATADLDGDGRLDVLVCADGACAVVLQDPAAPGSWRPPVPVPGLGGERVAVGDLDGDGRCDLVVSGERGVLAALQSPFERGRFTATHALSREECAGLALRDLDRDGALEVVFVETKTGAVVSHSGDPHEDLRETLRLHGLPPGVPRSGVHVAVGDLDGDGREDLVVAHPVAGSSGALEGEVRVFSPGP